MLLVLSLVSLSFSWLVLFLPVPVRCLICSISRGVARCLLRSTVRAAAAVGAANDVVLYPQMVTWDYMHVDLNLVPNASKDGARTPDMNRNWGYACNIICRTHRRVYRCTKILLVLRLGKLTGQTVNPSARHN